MKYLKPSPYNRKLAVIFIVYLTLAILYSIIVPIGRGADEWAHYWYAQFIAQNGRLPVNAVEREAAGYKSDWPPLYHLSAAAITAWIETDGPPTFKYRPDTQPGKGHIRRHLVSAQGPDAILHTEDELFPWQQEILVWRLGRFLSISFSLGTLLVTYFIALEVFAVSHAAGSRGADESRDQPSHILYPTSRLPSPQTLALVSVAFLAFIPRFLFTGMLFNYDSLTLLLASLFLWLAIRVAKGYYVRWGFWGLGALAGLALVTKYLTVLLPLEIVVLAFSRGAEEQGGRGENTISPLLKLGKAALAFLLVTSGWFGYLLLNFNEIDTYGPVLGTLAPLLRGDGSDRTVEQIFALISSGQAPAPAHIETQSYTAWQIISEFPTTFWGNPITRPYPLNWFVWSMTVVAGAAVIGLIISHFLASLRAEPQDEASPPRFPASLPYLLTSLLLLHCLLPLPFMLIRLFGARDALEAVQGRHLLFLSGPAIAILWVWAWSRITYRVSRFSFYALLGLLLIGSISQLFHMRQVYPPPLPVRTTPYSPDRVSGSTPSITLPGGTLLIDYTIETIESSFSSRLLAPSSPLSALKVALIWQGGTTPPPEDYRTELALVDAQGHMQANWLAYQTQAYYPTRAWEAGDVIRDEGWLPVERLETAKRPLGIGDYQIRLRILNEVEPVTDWQTLSTYTLNEPASQRVSELAQASNAKPEWVLWQEGQIAHRPPTFRERETAQFTSSPPRLPASPPLQLIGPDSQSHAPASAGTTWANFIIGPNWPPGDYRLQSNGEIVLRVAENQRNFQAPTIAHPLAANFENQVKLLGYDLPTRRVQPGEGLPLTLYWQGLRWMNEDFVIFNRLLDNQGIAWGGYDRLARENYSTLLWAPGEIITDGFAAPIAADAPAGIYTLNLGWYRQVNEVALSLHIFNPETGQPTGATSVTVGPIKVGGPPPGITVTEVTPQTEVNVALGEQIKLLGFDLINQQITKSVNGELSPASSLPRLPTSSPLWLTLYWQALAPPATDYTVFVHVRDAVGETVAQKDNPPVGGAYPTGLWDTGEIIKDEISISLEQLKPGQYDLVAGMYDFTTGLRLPVAGSPDGSILLQSFEVGE